MPILQITHEDGRVFNVAEQAYEDLYKPFGFEATGVVYAGSVYPYTDEYLAEAKAFEKAGGDPNATVYTLETASNQARAAGQNDRATNLAEQANALRKAQSRESVTVNPPNTDLSAGPVAKENDLSIGVEGEDVTPVTGGNTDGSAPADTGEVSAKASAAATTGKEADAKGSGSGKKGS